MSRDLTDEEFVQQLIDAGWDPLEAAKVLQRMLADAAEEDGVDF